METVLTGLALASLILLGVPLVYPLVPLGYARLTRAARRRRARAATARRAPAGARRGLSAVVCFVDEGDRLRESATAFLTSSPELDKELVLVGDGPDLATREVARAIAGACPGVVLYEHPGPRGKAASQAEGVRLARHETLLFLDANTRVSPETPGLLAFALDEPGVAYATGRIRYVGSDQGLEDDYWDLEERLKQAEDGWLGVLGASGGLLCCRRRDYVPCRSEDMLDLVIPCLIERITKGRGRYLPRALATEPSRRSVQDWKRTRIRIQARAVGSLPQLRGWLVGAGPGRALQFLGHKLLRWYSSVSLLVLLLCLLQLPWPAGRWTAAAVLLLLAGSLMLTWTGRGSRRVSLLTLPGYAFYVQLAGILLAAFGRPPRTWTH